MTEQLLFAVDSLEALSAVQPSLDDLPDGALGRFEVVGFGIGPFADLVGAEIPWSQALNPAGLRVLDVYGEGFNKAIVTWQVDASLLGLASTAQASRGFYGRQATLAAPVLLLVVIAGVIVALGLLGWVIQSIKGFVELPQVQGILWGILLLVGLALVATSRKRQGASP